MKQLIHIFTITAFAWALSTAFIPESAFGAGNERFSVQTAGKQLEIQTQQHPITIRKRQTQPRPHSPINRNGLMQQKPPSITLPLRLYVNVINSAEISLKWNKINCGAYRVEKKKGYGTFTTLHITARDETSIIDINVDPDTNYTYRVYAASCTGRKDSYSNEVTVKTGSNNNPFTETVYCPTGAQEQMITHDQGVWQGDNDTYNTELSYVFTREDFLQKQVLYCYYKLSNTSITARLMRAVPAGSCLPTNAVMERKSFKCKKGAF